MAAPRLCQQRAFLRTAALANELAQHPGLALTSLVHALAAETFFFLCARVSCLKLKPLMADLRKHAEGIGESRAVAEMEARHEAWEKRIPTDPLRCGTSLSPSGDAERLALLAHCVSLTVDAVKLPKSSGLADLGQHGDWLAEALNLDMANYWQPTAAGYLGRLTKQDILKTVREAVSPEAAQTIEVLKKPAMAERAEKLLTGKGWLPEILRRSSD